MMLSVLLWVTGSYAQDCKFEKEETDPFTGGRVLHSKLVPMMQAMSDMQHNLKVQKNGDEYYIYMYGTITSGDPLTFHIQEGQNMMFLLQNKDTVLIRANETIMGKAPDANQGWLGSSYRGAVFNTYAINVDQLERLKASPVEIIRFHFTASDNRDLKIDRKKIPVGAKEKFQHAIQCVMNN